MIRLSKIPHKDLCFFIAALQYNYQKLQLAYEAAPYNILLEYELGITNELFSELAKKNNKDFPPKNTSIVLYNHKAKVLLKALQSWLQSLSKISYEANKALSYKNLIHQNITNDIN